MKGLPVAGSPGGKGREGEQGADEGDADELLREGLRMVAGAERKDQRGRKGDGDECTIGTEQRGEGDGEGEAERSRPLRLGAESGPWPIARGRA